MKEFQSNYEMDATRKQKEMQAKKNVDRRHNKINERAPIKRTTKDPGIWISDVLVRIYLYVYRL